MALVSRPSRVFEHSPLNRDQPNAFRLFDLHPGKPSAPIECTLYESLRRTSPIPNWLTNRRLRKALNVISSRTSYSALSYTWGDGQPTRSISMNGLPLKVTPNLEEALRSLRDDSEGGQSRTLWVDAICINQTDTLERNHQVAQMQEIYADAEQVIVWLGPSTATSSMAIYFIEEIYEAFEELEIDKRYDNDFKTMDKKIRDALLASTKRQKQLEKRWQAVFELMLKPWWDRVWVIQELVSARRANLYCGKTHLPWPAFALATWLLHSGPLAAISGTPWHTFLNVHENSLTRAFGLVGIRYNFQTGHPVGIGLLLDLARIGQCKDPRDKLYAVLGLADDQIKKRIQIDYSKPVLLVYANIVNIWHAIYGTVTVISLSELTADTTFPSWCPDFTRDRHQLSFYNTVLGKTFALAKRPARSATFSEDRRSLYIDGFNVDVVGETKREETKSMLQAIDEGKDWSQLVYNMVRTLNISEKARKPLEKRAQRGTELGQDPLETVLRNILEAINGTLANSQDAVGFDSPRIEDFAVFSRGQRTQGEEAFSKKDLSYAAKFYMRNRAIVISKTRYFGLAPGCTRPGDHIFHLFGLGFPAILRPNSDGSWFFVGEAFILGLVRGEAKADYERGIHKAQRLELR